MASYKKIRHKRIKNPNMIFSELILGHKVSLLLEEGVLNQNYVNKDFITSLPVI